MRLPIVDLGSPAKWTSLRALCVCDAIGVRSLKQPKVSAAHKIKSRLFFLLILLLLLQLLSFRMLMCVEVN